MNSAHLSDLIYCSAKPFSGSSSVETAQSLQAGHAFTLLSFLCSSFRLEASLGETKRYISTGLQKLPESFSVRLTSKSCSCLYFSEEMVMQASSCIFTETGCWEMHLLREKYSLCPFDTISVVFEGYLTIWQDKMFQTHPVHFLPQIRNQPFLSQFHLVFQHISRS